MGRWNMIIRMSLLDLLSARMNCMNLSDLRFLDRYERIRLRHEINKIPAEAASCKEWNDALQYLAGDSRARATAREAKAALLKEL
jgi:hypothetical protein